MGKIEKMQQIRDILTGANKPKPIFYKNEGEPDPPDFRPGIDLMYVNVSKHYRFDKDGNAIEI